MRYKILPHADDVGLKIYGKDLEELLINGAYGLAKTLDEDVDKRTKFIRGFEKIKIESAGRSTLVVDFLSELLTLSSKNKKVYPKVKILKLSDVEVIAHASGASVDGFNEDIKEVSHHDVEIKEGKRGLETTLRLAFSSD